MRYNKNATISVVIPVYNRAKLLRRALLSVIAQSHPVDEIIIVDDGSTDDCISVVHDMMQKHFRCINKGGDILIRILFMEHCGMPGKVRNKAIYHSRGEWIAFLDSDDEWLSQKIEKQLHWVQSTKTNICHTREIWMRGNKKISQKSQKHMREGMIFFDALQKCIIGPSTVLIHKSIFQKYGMFREDMQVAEDYELWLRITAQENVSYVDDELVVKNDCEDDLHLSKKYSYIESFRIQGLLGILKDTFLKGKQRELVRDVLSKKIILWNKGALKRKYSFIFDVRDIL